MSVCWLLGLLAALIALGVGVCRRGNGRRTSGASRSFPEASGRADAPEGKRNAGGMAGRNVAHANAAFGTMEGESPANRNAGNAGATSEAAGGGQKNRQNGNAGADFGAEDAEGPDSEGRRNGAEARSANPGAETADGVLPRGVPAGFEDMFEWGIHPGADGVPVMYTLRACRHCDHLAKWLEQRNITFHTVRPEAFSSEARAAVVREIRARNPRTAFPLLVLPDGSAVIGFREAELRKALHLNA